uniref:Uncharacterized protein n=1 Tax=Acrobeloides nanus TaxID=290746 RepID=A0A914CNZ5_9BILA
MSGKLARSESSTYIPTITQPNNISRTYSIPDFQSYLRNRERQNPDVVSFDNSRWYDKIEFGPQFWRSLHRRRAVTDYYTEPYYRGSYYSRYRYFWNDSDFRYYNRRYLTPYFGTTYTGDHYKPYRRVHVHSLTMHPYIFK